MTAPMLRGLAYATGSAHAIDDLAEREGAMPETIAALRSRGLERYCESTSLAAMCLQSIAETLESSALSPEQIDAIVFANSSADWDEADEMAMNSAFHESGFGTTTIVGVMMQGCSASSTALRVAVNLIGEGSGVENVLIVLAGRVRASASRVPPGGATVFSDGAASCVVSSEYGDFAILANDNCSNTYLAATLDPQSTKFGRYVEAGFHDLSEIARRTLKKAGVPAADVRALFGTNGSSLYPDWMAAAAQLPAANAYRSDIARFAHVHSCDNFISLKNCMEHTAFAAGDHVMLMSWSPFVLSASVLRYLAGDPLRQLEPQQ
jgi:3-oxoacyl-[acyl-carrier-protein] synthase-3